MRPAWQAPKQDAAVTVAEDQGPEVYPSADEPLKQIYFFYLRGEQLVLLHCCLLRNLLKLYLPTQVSKSRELSSASMTIDQ